MADSEEASRWESLPEALASKITNGLRCSLSPLRLTCSAWRASFTSSCSEIEVKVPPCQGSLLLFQFPVKHLDIRRIRLVLPILSQDEGNYEPDKLIDSILQTLTGCLSVSSSLSTVDLSLVRSKDREALKLASRINLLPVIQTIQGTTTCAPLSHLTLLHDSLTSSKGSKKSSFISDLISMTSLQSLTLHLMGSFTEDYAKCISHLASLTKLEILCITDSMIGSKSLRALHSTSLQTLLLEPAVTNVCPDLIGLLGQSLPSLQNLRANINRSPHDQVFSFSEKHRFGSQGGVLSLLSGLTKLSLSIRGFSDAMTARAILRVLMASGEPRLVDLELVLMDDRGYNAAPTHPWDAGDLSQVMQDLDLHGSNREEMRRPDAESFWISAMKTSAKIIRLHILDERKSLPLPTDLPLVSERQDYPFDQSILISSGFLSSQLPLLFSNQYRELRSGDEGEGHDPLASSQLTLQSIHPWCLGALCGIILTSASLTELDLRLPAALGDCLLTQDRTLMARLCPSLTKLGIKASFASDTTGDLGLSSLPLIRLSLHSIHVSGDWRPPPPLDLSLLPHALEVVDIVGFKLRVTKPAQRWHALHSLRLETCGGDAAHEFESANGLKRLQLIGNKSLVNFFPFPKNKKKQSVTLSQSYPHLEHLASDNLFAPYRLFQEIAALRCLERMSVRLLISPSTKTSTFSSKTFLTPLIKSLPYGITEISLSIRIEGSYKTIVLLKDDAALLELPSRCPHLRRLEIKVSSSDGDEQYSLPISEATRAALRKSLPHTIIIID